MVVTNFGKLASARPLLHDVVWNSFSASSSWDENYSASNSRILSGAINPSCCWHPANGQMENQNVTVDLGSLKVITEIHVQGRGNGEYLHGYVIHFKQEENEEFRALPHIGLDPNRSFPGPVSTFDLAINKYFEPFFARFVRIVPVSWCSTPAFRWEIVGAPAEPCEPPRGFPLSEEAKVELLSVSRPLFYGLHDHAFRQSSCLNEEDYGAKTSRISSPPNPAKVYHPADGCYHSQWVLVDLGRPHLISEVLVQGRCAHGQHVTAYQLQYKVGERDEYRVLHHIGQDSERYFPGPVHDCGTFSSKYFQPFVARYVKILPIQWVGVPAFHWELIGAPVPEAML